MNSKRKTLEGKVIHPAKELRKRIDRSHISGVNPALLSPMLSSA